MSAISNYLENRLIDALVRGVRYDPPPLMYVALFNTDPGDEGLGEVVAPSYARVPVGRSLTSWSGTNGEDSTAPSTGDTATSFLLTQIAFQRCDEPWGTVTHAGLFDAPTGGNMLFAGAFGSSFVASRGVRVKFPAKSIAVSISTDNLNLFSPVGSVLLGTAQLMLDDAYLSL